MNEQVVSFEYPPVEDDSVTQSSRACENLIILTGLALASKEWPLLFFSKSKMTHLFFEKTSCTKKGLYAEKKCTGNYECLGKQSISVDKVITHIIEQKMTDS